MKLNFSFMLLETLVLMLYFTDIDCRVQKGYAKETNKTEDSVYFFDFRQIIIDARHVLEEVLSKGKVRVLGVDDWKW